MTDELEQLGLAAAGLGERPDLESEVMGAELDRGASSDGAVYLGPSDYANTSIQLRAGFAPPQWPWSPTVDLEEGLPYVPDQFGVIGADDRRFVNDRRLPWCSVGHFQSGGAGVLIGPRHVLTATHLLDWAPKRPGEPGPFEYRYAPGSQVFRPGYCTGPRPKAAPAPFGEIPVDAVVTAMPWPGTRPVYGVTDAAGNPIKYARHLDVAVCILRERVGERAGWFGFSGWTHDWNGKSHFNHMGYPAIAYGANDQVRPTMQTVASGASIHNPSTQALRVGGGAPINASVLTHDFDVQTGQSGGPIFGWFAGERMPRVVGVVNGSRPDATGLNSAAGGMQMLRVIDKALKMFP